MTLLAPSTSRIVTPRPADDLPTWADAAFPDGLTRQSQAVWAPRDYAWDMSDEAQINVAAGPRAGGGLAVTQHFHQLLGAALDRSDIDTAAELVALDLHSGDGARSVVPWLTLLPAARIIATDPSSVLLAALAGRARALGAEGRVMGVLAEPHSIPAAPASVDLISGVACLLEMDDPDQALAAAARALRPGGHAIFLAPFDGHGVLRVAYERILVESGLRPDEPLALDVAATLQAFIDDVAKRTLPDRNDPAFAQLEQKWLFSRGSLEDAARALGFRDITFVSHNDHETLYRDVGRLQVQMVTGREDAVLPDWALDVLDSFDRALRPPVKRLLMLDGTIILKR